MNYKLTGYKGVIFIFLIYHFVSILISTIFYFSIGDFLLQYNPNLSDSLNVLENTIILTLLYFYYKNIKTFNLKNKKIDYSSIYLISILVLSLRIFVDPIFRFNEITNITNITLLENSFNNKTFNYYSLIISFINTIILAPILEEILYRGYILRTLKTIKGFNNLLSILVSSFLFTIAHFPYSINTLIVFIIGILTAIIVLKLGLKYAIIFHSFYNLIWFTLENIFYKDYLFIIKTLEFNYIYWTTIILALSTLSLIVKKIAPLKK